MTQEEKAKRYDEAYKIAEGIHRFSSNPAEIKRMEEIFPALKEDEDERVRKTLIDFFNRGAENGEQTYGVCDKDILSWLEKQKERSPLSKDEEYTLARIIEYLEDNDCPSEWKDLLYDVYALPYQKEHKPADKFKPGDWVVFNNKHQSIYQVEKIEDGYYILRHTHGGTFRVRVLHDESLRLWTIDDAKDGDILVDKDNNIGIYKEIEGICWHSYIYLGCDNRIYGFSIGGSHTQNNTKPATKEQREQLEKAMADAGFTLDFEKKELKELKKIEPKFHEGDKIRRKNPSSFDKDMEVARIEKDYYVCNHIGKFSSEVVPFSEEPGYDLIEQNPAWSEEDERTLRTIISDGIRGAEFDMQQIDWLKSLKERVQPKQEWSDEDEATFTVIGSLILDNFSAEDASKTLTWLHSLKPQNTWKPSDEQLDALHDAAVYVDKSMFPYPKGILMKLYKQLKKLREE